MSAVRPRCLVHRGLLPAAGVLLGAPPGRTSEARSRALALWTLGVRVHAVDGGLLIRFPRPTPLDAAAAPGHLLVEDAGALLAAPLSPAERSAIAPPPGAIVAVRGGRAVVLVPGPELDPAGWLDLSPGLVEVEPLGAPPPPPVALAPAREPELRTALGVAAQAPEAAKVVERLRAAGARPRGDGDPSGSAGIAVLLGGIRGVLARARGALRARLGRWSSGGATSGRALAARASGGAGGPGLVRRALVRLAFALRVARLAGLRQGAYLGRVHRMFERGDLDEALRHAVPLGRDPASGLPVFGTPRRRDALTIAAPAPPGGSLLVSGPDLFGELQRLYRDAHHLLARQGRIDEAAFVLAELLRADEEAVSFLERHGRLRLAAEVAESRGLPVGLVVRQWFLAGEVDRAVALARAGGAFADAVDRLERSGRRRESEALRLTWAEDLAAAGDLEAAVGVARGVEVARALVLAWIHRAVAAGGASGDALLATWLDLDPGRFEEIRARVLDAAADSSEDGPPRRAAAARGLLGAATSPASRALARPVLRGLLRDAAAGDGPAVAVARLVSLAADGALDADLPPVERLRTATGPPALRIGADDRGARPVLDAAVLPGGRVLAALGEAGAALLARDGRVVARLDAPAHRLVVSDAGTRALAIAPRGEAVRVTALDLRARTARPLRDLHLGGFAPSFDGAAWVVAAGREILILDTLRDDLRTIWRVDGLPGPAGALHRDARSIRFITALETSAVETWRYELPGPVLRERGRREVGTPGETLAGLGLAGDHWFAVLRQEAGASIRPAWGASTPAHGVPGSWELLEVAGGAAFAAAFATDQGVEVVAVPPAPLTPPATISLGGASAARIRLDGTRLTACDALGRIAGIDLGTGRVTHVLRV